MFLFSTARVWLSLCLYSGLFPGERQLDVRLFSTVLSLCLYVGLFPEERQLKGLLFACSCLWIGLNAQKSISIGDGVKVWRQNNISRSGAVV